MPVNQTAAATGSIRTKLALFVGGLLLAAIVTLILGGYTIVRSLLRESVEERLTLQAHAKRDFLADYVAQQHERIGLVASRTRLRQMVAGHLRGTVTEDAFLNQTRRILEDARAATEGFLAISMTDPGGRIITSTDGVRLGKDLSAAPHYVEGRNRRVLGIPFPAGDRYLAPLAGPARDGEGNLLGVVVVELDVSPLRYRLSGTSEAGETAEVLVGRVDGSGIDFIFPSRLDGGGRADTTAHAGLALALRGETGVGTFVDHRGRQVLSAHEPITQLGWGLVAKMDVTEAYAPVQTLQAYSAGCGLILLFFGVVVSRVVATRFTRPILDLAATATTLSQGKLEARAAHESHDEVGELASAFNAMAASIQRGRDELEERVNIRTRELREANRRLTESEGRLQGILDNTTAVIYIKDLDGRYVLINRQFEDLFSVTNDSILGKTDHEVFPAEMADAFRQNDRRVANTGEVVLLEETAPHDDGPHTYISSKFPLSDESGDLYAVAGISTDITDRKRAEDRLRETARDLARSQLELLAAKEEAERANAAKSEFLANMSHEIRTPLNGVIGMAELLGNTDLDDRQRGYLRTVIQSAESLLALINDILDFSKIEAGRFELESIPFGLRDLVGNALQPLGLRASENDVELTCRIAPEVPDTLVGDPTRLRQIIVNLVGNAVKFTQEGEIVVEIEAVEASDGQVRLRLSVSDTGIGIAPGNRKKIFNVFEQEDASTTRRFGGTGLGLAITAELARMMDTRVAVESEEGKGSVFSLEPLFGRSTEAVETTGARPDAFGDARVLIVDDNDTNRQILKEITANWGLDTVAVADGGEALDAVESAAADGTPFRLGLIDLMMPEMDGVQLAGELERRGHTDMSLLLLSSADVSTLDADAQSRFTNCLIKPIIQSDLFDSVSRALDPESAGTTTPIGLGRVTTPRHVLVAEDGEINRTVAESLLRERGHTVVSVVDGREALEACGRETFDVILMDVQMPEMDGFEATRAIRRRETDGRTPIIALTAHTMKGDRERCLAAGMDGYLSKPVRAAELYAAVEAGAVGVATRAEPAQAPAPELPFDREGALKQIGGHPELLTQILTQFSSRGREILSDIEAAYEEGEAGDLHRQAHSLKSTAGMIHAGPVARRARELEEAAHRNAQADVDAAVDRLREEMGRLLDAIETELGETER